MNSPSEQKMRRAREARKTQETANARRHIVVTATAVFADGGYHKATMDEVARATGYSVGSLYNYFPSKAALYGAVLEEIKQEIAALSPGDGMGLDATGSDFSSLLLDLMLRQFEIAKRYKGFFIGFYKERSTFEPSFGFEVGLVTEAASGVWLDDLIKLVTEGQERGEVRAESSRTVAFVIAGALTAWFRRWLGGEVDDAVEESLREVVDMICNGICSREEVP